MLIACRNGMHLDISGERLKPDGTGYLHHTQIIGDKEKQDDLSPAFLKKMSFEETQLYLDTHSELMGHPCKWLHFDDKKASCEVYSHRSSDCRNYPEGEGDCRVGKLKRSSSPIGRGG